MHHNTMESHRILGIPRIEMGQAQIHGKGVRRKGKGSGTEIAGEMGWDGNVGQTGTGWGGETGRNGIGAGIVRDRIGGDMGIKWIRDETVREGIGVRQRGDGIGCDSGMVSHTNTKKRWDCG